MRELFVNLGLPHTGTESFATACLLVGIPVLHIWSEAEQSAAVRTQFLDGDMSLLPSCSDGCSAQALTDSPFYALGRQLSRTYPTSRFVCTSRTKESWVESMVFHAVAGGSFLPRQYNVTTWAGRWRNTTRDRAVLAQIFDAHAEHE
jgi:hypothetical protein